jgi:hypothetical protein
LKDAIKYRKARRELDNKLKQKQKQVFESLKNKYQPTETLAFKPLNIQTNEWNVEQKKKTLKNELNKQIEIMARKRLAAKQLIDYPLN